VATHVYAEVASYSKARLGARLVVLALADQASKETRIAHASIELLMRHSLLSERGVQQALRQLTAMGEISPVSNSVGGRTSKSDAQRGHATYANSYRVNEMRGVNGAKFAGFPESKTPQLPTKNPAASDTKTPQLPADTISVNSSVTPQQLTALSGSAARPPTERELAKVILHELNRRTFKPNGTGFEPVEPNLKPLSARIREYGADKVARVTVRKIMQWWGTNMEEFLRPKTLYNATNFANYVGEGRLKRSDGRKVVEAFTEEQIKIVRAPFEIPGEQGRITP
jgi:uncharacterized phage protein (TIGR02220 family)